MFNDKNLFNNKNLKPTTISGYRTDITGHSGSLGMEIGQSYELNRLIASFHRPMKDTVVPSTWTYLWYS